MSFILSADTGVGGRLPGADGRPLPNVCLRLMPAGEAAAGHWKFDSTDEQGRYAPDEIPPGRPLTVVNDSGQISSAAPFCTAFYPGVFERAAVVTVAEGASLKDFGIHIPAPEPTRTARGVLLYADGRPAAGLSVAFEADAVPEGYDGAPRRRRPTRRAASR